MHSKVTLLLAFVFCLTIPLFPQTAATGVVLGTVSDPSGSSLMDSRVELINAATGTRSSVMSGAQGQYAFPSVLPGTYNITAGAQGYRTTTVTNANVQVNASSAVNFRLELGEVTWTVSVTAAESQIALQTADATIGDVIGPEALLRLPTRLRQAQELLLLQPGTTPQTGGDSGGSIAGAINDQTTFTLDGIDITDNSTNSTVDSDHGARPILMVPVESIDEFRVAVANANATFTRGSGGQVSLIQRSGTNQFHGSLFWYTQNSILNANSWDNNRLANARPHVEDNRYGGRLGGPILRNKTFFFLEYEARRYPQTSLINATVPTASLRQGILQFRDAAGNNVAYDLATSNLCGASGTSACDPRGVGMSPTMKAMMALDPQGNNSSRGDGLNTIGFTANTRSPLTDDSVTGRLDHVINSKWRVNGSFSYSRDLVYNSSPLVLDIRDPKNVLNLDQIPVWTNAFILGVTGQISSTLVNTFRAGDVRNRNGSVRPDLTAVASGLGLPGTTSEAGYVAVTPNIFSPPVTMNNSVRTLYNNNVNLQFTDDLSWTKGRHLFQAGANFQRLPQFHIHNGKAGGALSSLNATTTADTSFLTVPASDRPPTCGSGITANCLPSSVVSTWDSLYTTVLGMMNDDNVFLVRNAQLQAQPLGTSITMDALSYFYSFYGQDTWRIRPSLTFTVGLNYGLQTPYTFANRQEAVLVDASTSQVLSPLAYLRQRAAAAGQGQIYNPLLGFQMVGNSGRSAVYDTDYGDIAPRASLAWNPSFTGGILGKLFGERKTVIRGGFGIYYSRFDSQDSVIGAGLTAGPNSAITTGLVNCGATGTPGAGCISGASNVAQSDFRIGVDGKIPIPAYAHSIASPYIPAGNYSELVSFGVDSAIKQPRVFTGAFTVQRSVGHGVFLEAGWSGRYGRDLFSNIQLGASPYFFKDSASGQTFAQAYDMVSNQMRAGQPVTVQPWFEGQLPGAGKSAGFASTTALLASREASFFTQGLVSSLFDSTSGAQPGLNALRTQLGLQAYDETQVNQAASVVNLGWSNYNALLLTVRHVGPKLTFDLNYTYSKSLDTNQSVQNSAGILANPMVPAVDYAPSRFDHKQIFNALFVYNLPTRYSMLPALLNRIAGGFRVSGIVTALTGAPLFVNEGSQVWGGGQRATYSTPAVPTIAAASIHSGVNASVISPAGVGTAGNPATGGTGLNLFADPQSVYNDFTFVQLSSSVDGSGHPIRGLGYWNVDSSLGKIVKLTEHKSLDLTFDFFNLFNHPNFSTPFLSQTGSTANFGVITNTLVPANRQASSRWIMFSARLEF